jgi:RNA polymerase sigma factor (sigma-70 family)
MSDGPSFSGLVRRLQAGSESAAAEVFRRYAERLADLARGRIEGRLRGRLSASDVVQEALHSFFRRQRERPFDLDGEGALWGLLARITLNKYDKMRRALTTRKRDPGPLLPLQPEGPSASDWEVADDGPTPEEAALLEETLAELLGGLDGLSQRICRLRLEGHSVREIAAQVNLTEETVSRKLHKVKARLSELLGQPNPGE